MLEERGVVGAADGAKPRDIIRLGEPESRRVGAGNADELAAEPAPESEEERV